MKHREPKVIFMRPVDGLKCRLVTVEDLRDEIRDEIRDASAEQMCEEKVSMFSECVWRQNQAERLTPHWPES